MAEMAYKDSQIVLAAILRSNKQRMTQTVARTAEGYGSYTQYTVGSGNWTGTQWSDDLIMISTNGVQLCTKIRSRGCGG